MSQLIVESRRENVKMELSVTKLKMMKIYTVKRRQVKHLGVYRAQALRQQLTEWLTSSPIGLTVNGANTVVAFAQSVQTRGRSHHPIGR